MIRPGSTQSKIPLLLSFGGFIILALISILTAWKIDHHNDEMVAAKMAVQADSLSERAMHRINLYQYGLRGARGFVLASGESFSRTAFQHYIQTRDAKVEFPGARGFGFIRRVPVDQEVAFLEQARIDDYSSFALRQLNQHDAERYVIQYIEPVERNLAAVGLDIGSESDRRAAADAAIRTGTTQLTAPITLVQATGNPQQSFLIMLPVYQSWSTPETEQGRWHEAIGWTYAPLLMPEILASLNVDQELFYMRLTDTGDPERPQVFYDKLSNKQLALFPQTRVQDVLGRKWQIELAASSAYVDSLNLLNPSLVLAYALLTSLVLSCLIFVVGVNARNRTQFINQQSELATILEGSSDAIISADMLGNVLTWNHGAEVIFGYSKSEAVNHQIYDLIVPDELKDEAMRVYADVLAGQSRENLITTRQRKNGRTFDSLINIAPMRNAQNSVISVSITLRDISELTQAQRALQDINSKLELHVSERTLELGKALRENRTLLETINAQFLYSEADLQGNITYVNDNLCRASGYSREELIGESHNIMNSGIHPKDFWAGMWEQVSRGENWRAEVCNRNRNGEYRWYDSVIAPVMNELGQIERIISLRSDITERIQVGLQLQSIGEQLSVAINVAKLGVWTWDLRNDSLKWNDRMYEIYEYSKELETAGLKYEHWRDRVHLEDVETAEASLIAAVEGRGEYNPTFRLDTPSGGLRYILAGAQVERDSQGKALKVTGINLDITDQTLLEAELRTAKEEADAASESKSQFLANMSHEIRTPMNAVLGMLNLVKKTQLSPQQQDYISKANTAAKSLLGLLNDILDFSKISAKKLTLDPTVFDLDKMLQDMAVVLSGNLRPKFVEMLIDLDPRLPRELMADRLRLQQILVNLTGNALKFTQQGQVFVRLIWLDESSTDLSLRIEVEDTGIGIAKDKQSLIFEGFNQAEASTTRKFGGTGLGLVISKRLVELMNGTLQVESEPGKGTRFWFDLKLPLVRDTTLADRMPEQQPLNILIADDSPMMLELLQSGLSRQGWSVSTARNGEEALALFDAASLSPEPFQVLLLDWHMPGLNSLDVCHHVRQTVTDPADSLPILLLTTYERELIQEGDQAEYDELLVKPITIRQILDIVQKRISALVITQDETLVDVPEKPLQGLRILVVEDIEINRQIAFELLSQAGANVTLAEGGVSGVYMVTQSGEAFDLVIMDLQMPDIDGYEATRRIRSTEGFKTLPILAMTANVSAADREACLQAGMNDHVGKPFEIEDVVQRILRLKDKQSPEICDSEQQNKTETSQPAQTPIVESKSVFLARVGGDSELAMRLITQFNSDIVTFKNALYLACKDGDSKAASLAAHSIKGFAGTLGALRLSQAAALLDKQVKASSWPSDIELEEFDDLIRQAIDALNAWTF